MPSRAGRETHRMPQFLRHPQPTCDQSCKQEKERQPVTQLGETHASLRRPLQPRREPRPTPLNQNLVPASLRQFLTPEGAHNQHRPTRTCPHPQHQPLNPEEHRNQHLRQKHSTAPEDQTTAPERPATRQTETDKSAARDHTPDNHHSPKIATTPAV